jgi:anaerobic selenocysteine-containing dehydrogenase
VPVKPGQEALLAGAIAKLIAEEGFGGEARAARAEALQVEVDVAAVAEACDTDVEALTMLARVFAEAGKPLAIPGNPVAGAENGVAMVQAVQMLNVIAGAATMYPGVSAPVVAAQPSPFADVKALIDKMNAGAVKVLLVYGANPLYELPRALGFRDAVRKVEYVVSFAPVIDETAVQANLVLPERTYLEGWGYKVASPAMGRLVISSQQPVVKPFHETEATGPHYAAGDVMLTAARGIPEAAAAMPWTDEVAYLKQMVAGLPAGAFGGSDEATRWSRYLQHGGWWEAAEAEAAALPAEPAPVEISAAAFPGDEAEYPFYLHVYTPVMLGAGSAAGVPWLQGSPDPMTTVSWQSWIEVNPKTAEELGLQDGDVVKLTTPGGAEVEGPVYIYPAIRPDTVAVPVGQGHSEAGRYAKDRGFNAARLLGTEADATGAHLAWASQRVKLEATGERAELPLFEDKEGAQEPLHL